MNRYYTATIPYGLAQRLKEKGMPIETEGENTWCPSYAECFDWLMKKGMYIAFNPIFGESSTRYSWSINYKSTISVYPTWHEAAEAAITKALELI